MTCDCCCLRYPNIACELLTSDVGQIIEKLIEDNVLIDKVYAFLGASQELNPLLASFFTKVLSLLLARKSEFVSLPDFCAYLSDDFSPVTI